jgi:hypothetical protein
MVGVSRGDPGPEEPLRPVRRTESSADVRAFEWPWDDGEVVWPCPSCSPWHLQVVVRGSDAGVWIREWHAASCPIWSEVEPAMGDT